MMLLLNFIDGDDQVGEWVAARLGWVKTRGTLWRHNDRW